MKIRNILRSAIMLMAVASSAGVEAAPAYTWNLSRDMMRTDFTTYPSVNPFGMGNVWTAMYDSVGTTHKVSNYKLLPTFTYGNWGADWATWSYPTEPALAVGVATKTFTVPWITTAAVLNNQGTPYMHPGPTFSSIIRWISPIQGIVNIMGRITDADPSMGNGIDWFVDKGNFTLMKGTLNSTLANKNDGAMILQQNIPVEIGTELYFIVSSKNDYWADTTHIDIVITSPN